MLKRLFAIFCGNAFCQKVLQFSVYVAQYFMGVGAGSTVGKSGEAAIFNRLARMKGGPYTIFDVGANQGQFLAVVLSTSLKDFRVHAFEPSSESFRLLTEKMGGRPEIVLNNVGLGRERGTLDLFFDKPGSRLASLTSRKLDHINMEFTHSEKVTIDTVDDYCGEHNINYIDLLKIDVEGHELDVLAGATNMLKGSRVGMVTFEFGGCNIDTRTFFKDYYYLFTENGMSLFRITPSGYLQPITHYGEILEQFRTTNYLAIRND
jgi:FkbM family methyltransferase